MEIFLILTFVYFGSCTWETEWLIPIQNSYSKETPTKTPDEIDYRVFDDEIFATPVYKDQGQQESINTNERHAAANDEVTPSILAEKLKDTLRDARTLAESLKAQIATVVSEEHILKESIVNGRSGVTALTLLLVGKLPRTYIIRDGFWTLCNGMVQHPGQQKSGSLFSELFSAPRCIGQEVTSRQDPCVFNSVVKYETLPRQRGSVYTEDDYLCLKPSFNQTLEQYRSVPRDIIDETCRGGVVKRLADNFEECGVRTMAEYTYYPHRGSSSRLPLEYCSEAAGACRLTVAWHVSNSSIENFEYIKNDKAFKKFFMNVDVHSDQII